MRDYKSEKKYVPLLQRYSVLKRGSSSVYVSRTGAVRDSGRKVRKKGNFYSHRRFR